MEECTRGGKQTPPLKAGTLGQSWPEGSHDTVMMQRREGKGGKVEGDEKSLLALVCDRSGW